MDYKIGGFQIRYFFYYNTNRRKINVGTNFISQQI